MITDYNDDGQHDDNRDDHDHAHGHCNHHHDFHSRQRLQMSRLRAMKQKQCLNCQKELL